MADKLWERWGHFEASTWRTHEGHKDGKRQGGHIKEGGSAKAVSRLDTRRACGGHMPCRKRLETRPKRMPGGDDADRRWTNGGHMADKLARHGQSGPTRRRGGHVVDKVWGRGRSGLNAGKWRTRGGQAWRCGQSKLNADTRRTRSGQGLGARR